MKRLDEAKDATSRPAVAMALAHRRHESIKQSSLFIETNFNGDSSESH